MLSDCTELLKTIKKAAAEGVEAGKPVNICFGTVVGVAPLQINIDQKMTLGEKQLLLAQSVTDYSVKITVEWETEEKSGGTGEDSFAAHAHRVIGMKEIMIHNGLIVGDTVILIRQQGGQQYVVLDKIGT